MALGLMASICFCLCLMSISIQLMTIWRASQTKLLGATLLSVHWSLLSGRRQAVDPQWAPLRIEETFCLRFERPVPLAKSYAIWASVHMESSVSILRRAHRIGLAILREIRNELPKPFVKPARSPKTMENDWRQKARSAGARCI